MIVSKNIWESSIRISERDISLHDPTYFIADIASNHDHSLERSKELIWLAKESGADAVKFQHFKAGKIINDLEFKKLNNQLSHQSKWDKSVYEIFEEYEFNRSWNSMIAEEAKKAGIHFFTTPYDLEAFEELRNEVPAIKIGSGDITWIDFLIQLAKYNKPILLATGASYFEDIKRAVTAIANYNSQIVLMQCNTNYTGSLENFEYINLNVLRTFSIMYPGMILGLSDHTPGHATVLGAVALGARVIEKHFTDDNNRKGPDHPFSMNPITWREMVDRTRELELALGDGVKIVEKNEKDTHIIQRRGVYLNRDITTGEILREDDFIILRPAPYGVILPYQLDEVLGKKLKNNKKKFESITLNDIEGIDNLC